MTEEFDYPAAAPPPSGQGAAPAGSGSVPPFSPSSGPPTRRGSNGAANWVIAAVIVLILAVAGGLLMAWIVASTRAVPEPVAFASPTPSVPRASVAPSASLSGASLAPSEAPRFTPSPGPTVEITPAPFTYVVQPGDHLVNIAAMFQVAVQDIIDLNGITNPNLIQVGQELLIPGYGLQPTPKPTKPAK